MCDDAWGIEDAHVACRSALQYKYTFLRVAENTTNIPRMMGYLGAEAAVMYGTVPDDFLLDNVQCGGGEESLLHCR